MEEMMNNAMEEVVEETVPTIEAIAEETIVPAAQAIQEYAPAVVEAIPEAVKKHSKGKTIGLAIGVTAIVLFKPVKKLVTKGVNKLIQPMVEKAVKAELDKRAAEATTEAAKTEEVPKAEAKVVDSEEETKEK